MLTKLYFLRHGLADWPDWAGTDEERPLTLDGVEKMKAEAKKFKSLNLAPNVILASPLIRARQTADIVAERFGLPMKVLPALAPGFDLKKLDKIVSDLDDARVLMLVGHEPDFSTTISQLIGGGHIAMKKGGLARVDITSLNPLSGQLVWLLAPAVLVD